jgi:hypothetical protein
LPSLTAAQVTQDWKRRRFLLDFSRPLGQG